MKVRHIVVDYAFDMAMCRAAHAVWPSPDWNGWGVVYQEQQQRKRACNQWEVMPEPCRLLLGQMLFLDTSMFGLGALAADTGLWGGGMQDMGNGDALGLHIDANRHKLSGLSRRINAILFLSPQWDNNWGGQLELWNSRGEQCLTTITPSFGRVVLFASTDDSWHAVRQLTCPPDIRRMTLACWWYGLADGTTRRDKAQFLK